MASRGPTDGPGGAHGRRRRGAGSRRVSRSPTPVTAELTRIRREVEASAARRSAPSLHPEATEEFLNPPSHTPHSSSSHAPQSSSSHPPQSFTSSHTPRSFSDTSNTPTREDTPAAGEERVGEHRNSPGRARGRTNVPRPRTADRNRPPATDQPSRQEAEPPEAQELTILQFNCRGLRTRAPELARLIQEKQPHIVALQETGLPPDRPVPREILAAGRGYAVAARADSPREPTQWDPPNLGPPMTRAPSTGPPDLGPPENPRRASPPQTPHLDGGADSTPVFTAESLKRSAA